jgi:hypothetical protein
MKNADKKGTTVCTYDSVSKSVVWFDNKDGQIDYMGAGTTEPEPSLGIVCAYDSEKEAIAWFNVTGGKIDFIGYGSSAPSAEGFDQSDKFWYVTGVSLMNKKKANAQTA